MSDGGEERVERELADRSRQGDRAAFEAIVHRTARWVFVGLRLQGIDAHQCEDLTQETFLAAWQQIRSLTDPAAFRGWLWQIAQRKLLDSLKHGRRKRRSAVLEPSIKIDAIFHPAASPVAQAEDQEERERAVEMLRTLPEEYRLPLALRYLGGADYQTISKQLALSNGSLRGLLQRGLAMLRERMKAKEAVGGGG